MNVRARRKHLRKRYTRVLRQRVDWHHGVLVRASDGRPVFLHGGKVASLDKHGVGNLVEV